MSAVTFRPAPAVERIAKTLIGKYHTDLKEVDVRYVFRSEHAKSSGKAVFGRAKKISGLNAYLAQLEDPDETGIEGTEGDFFVIEIAEDIWRELKQDARVALVDHELSHCGTTYDKDENLKLVTKPHDLEEFNAIVERHGLWRPDVAEFDQALRLNFAAGSPDHVEEEVASREPSSVEEAVQDFVDAIPDGMSVTLTHGDERATIDKTDESTSSTDTGGEAAGGAATDPPGPQPSTPAQRLSLGRHIVALDESLTNEFLEWCRKKKVPPNPQHMSFEQARAALILVGEREPAPAT